MGKSKAEEEEAFPRGRPSADPGAGHDDADEKADRAQPKGIKTRKRSRASSTKPGDKEDEEDALEPGDQAPRSAGRLRAHDLAEGALLVAAVREATDEELTLNLPFNLLGFVSRAQATEAGESAESLPPLPIAYPVGRLVVAVVTAVVEVGQAKRHRIELSLRPSLANAGLEAEDIAPHMWLPAMVRSEEEHVLRLDFCASGLQGLLKKSEAETLVQDGGALKPGVVVQVGVRSVVAATGTIRCTASKEGSLGASPIKLPALKAGFIVHARVDKLLTAASVGKTKDVSSGANAGAIASFCGSLNGVIHWHHQGLGAGDGGGLKHKQRVTARVLAVVPGPQILVHLSLLPHLLDWQQPRAEALTSWAVGERVEGLPLDLLHKYGCRWRCARQGGAPGTVVAFCPASRMSEDAGVDNGDASASTKPLVGQKSELRVLSYNFLEYTVIVTRRPSDLKKDALVSPLELSPGQLVSGEISRICEYGLFVKLSDFVTALVHLRQLTDVPLAKVPDKFQVGAKLKCRVLRVNSERRQVSLTAKKSLARGSFQLSDFEQAKKDMLVTGYVSSVKEAGAIVSFFGDLFGLIPVKEMSKDEAPALGMNVKCRISNVNKNRRRLLLSLDLESGKEPAEFEGATEDELAPGDVAKAATAVESLAEGIVVQFSTNKAGESELKGFVPLPHLSDDLDQAKARHAAIAKALQKKGAHPGAQLLGDGVVLARHFTRGPKGEKGPVDEERDPMVLVSMKPTLCVAMSEGAFITDISQLQVAKLYTGYVKHILEGGVLVSFGSWRLAGFAPKHQLAKDYVEKPGEEFQAGQTVRALLTKVDVEKQRFTVNLSKPFASASDAQLLHREAESLSQYFAMQADLTSPSKSSKALLPGTLLDATVTSTKPYGVLFALDAHEGLTGLALKENVPDSMKAENGDKLRCCVLDFDVTSGIADVSLQPELVAGCSGAGLKVAPLPESRNRKRKRKTAGEATDVVDKEADSQEVHVLLALQKPAYSVLWSRDPPAILFAPAWERQPRWADPRPTYVHSLPDTPGLFSRILARSPHGGGQRVGKRKVSIVSRPEEELKVGSPMTMRVVSVKGLEVFCAAPNGIRGHVHATHLIDVDKLGSGGKAPVEKIKKKDVLEARVLQTQHRESTWHLELTCRPSLMNPQDLSIYEDARATWKNLKPGKQVAVAVEAARKNLVWVEVAPGIKGQISALDASADLGVLRALDKHFQRGQVFQAQVLRSQKKKELDLMLHGSAVGPAPLGRTLARLERLEDVSRGGIVAAFRLPGKRKGFVHVTELYDFWAEFPLRRLKPGNIYEAHVVEGGSEDGTERAELSLRSSYVHGQAESAEEVRPLTAASLKLGQKVSGYVINSGEKGVFVAISRKLVGRIKLKALSDQVVVKQNVASLHRPGELIRQATVVEINAEQNRVELSLRKADKGGKLTVEQLSVGDVVSGRVKAVEKYGLFVRIDNSSVDGLVHRGEISDTASVSLESYQVGSIIPRAKVLKIEGSKLWLGLKFDPNELEEDEDMDDQEDLADIEDDKADQSQKGHTEPSDDEDGEDEAAPKRAKKEAKKAAKVDSLEEDDDDDKAPWEQAAKTASILAEDTPNASFDGFDFADFKVAAESDLEADAPDDAEGDNASKRPSKRQKKAMKLAEAKEVQQHEAENAEARWATDPRSVEDFERLLLTQGDTSIVWIRYMAFHLKMSDLERARQVAERAVKHVGFAEGKERFNVWVAFMNLECTFGTEATADAVFRRAASHNDAKQVHLQLARIHERNNKLTMASKVYEACGRKFPQSKKVWLAQLSCLYRSGELDAGRKALPKCLAALPRRKHAIVVSKAALLEYQHGSAERGRSVFEGLLDSYPKRTDLWSVYIDAHVKAHTPPKVAKPDLAEVRSLLERCCALKLKATKMRFFFKRWLDFEKRYGDVESQELVRNKARQFVESQAA
jgi:rRNA biogenesis protein RRP5